MGLSLAGLDALVLDCQATAAAPRGHLLEIGWMRTAAPAAPPTCLLIRLPEGTRIPPAVIRITGISAPLIREGVQPAAAWRRLAAETASFPQQPVPTLIHFARFEQPFLRSLAGGVLPLDIVCTHDIATRVLPDLPRRSLRALAGYFGRAVGALRRSASHVEATAYVWRELLPLLHAEGLSTWADLQEWLAAPLHPARRSARVWPLPRDVRLALPDVPGVYRFHRTSGDVLYVGKSASLHHRVNSYFRKRTGIPERLLEMLSQARAITYDAAPTALEAALLEADEIKRLRPPYNVALGADAHGVWFAAPDLSARGPRPSARSPLGPFPSAELLDQFAALARGDRACLTRGRRGPEARVFDAGFTALCAAHGEWRRDDLSARARLLRLGTRLWREGRRDRELDVDGDDSPELEAAWTAEQVQAALERLARRAALARRRSKWLTRLMDVAVVWSEPGSTDPRLLVIECGDLTSCEPVGEGVPVPVPPGAHRSTASRRRGITVARFDRLRVLTTELKRLVSAGAPVSLRFDAAPPLTEARLARVLAWV